MGNTQPEANSGAKNTTESAVKMIVLHALPTVVELPGLTTIGFHHSTILCGAAREMGGKTEENESEIPVLPGTALFGHCLLTNPMGVINVCGALFTAARTPAVFSLPNESIFYGRPRIRRIR